MKKIFIKGCREKYDKVLGEKDGFQCVEASLEADFVMFFLTNSNSFKPKDFLEANVKDLYAFCNEFKNKKPMLLYSPREVLEPKNVYELSIMLAEDLFCKKAENACIVRDLSDVLRQTDEKS